MQEVLDFLTGPAAKVVFSFFMVLAYVYLTATAVRLFRRHPSTFSVAVLGFPGSGKTVYITTLFDQLQQGRSERIKLTPYGIDTVEEVTRNLNALSRGLWLPRTVPGNVFFFRAIASARDTGQSHLKLEIGDFAGEDLGELQPSSDRWLHKSDYFKYVIDADAIMLALDGPSLREHGRNPDAGDDVVNAFVAAVQIIADYKGAVGARRLATPIALLVMKSDLLGDADREVVMDRVHRLIAVCDTRCRSFKSFFVSSTGPLIEAKPSAVLLPEGVVESIEWAVKRAMSVTPLSVLQALLRGRREPERQRWDTFK
jgi:hypothetical protein